jgi:DNA-binding NarL/FixJ family response regulator
LLVVGAALLSSLQAQSNKEVPALTPREKDTLRELGCGHTNRKIAERLGIAGSTAREYTRSLMQKFGVRNRTMVVRRALELGLLLSVNS